MRLAVPKESDGERRVALIPASVPSLTEHGFEVVVQHDAGLEAGFSDQDYISQGAEVVDEPWRGASVLVGVRAPAPASISSLAAGASIVALFSAPSALDVVQAARAAGANLFSLELLPRITRAQSMDALSSQATVAGYRGMLLAATYLPRFFPMFMTAAGTIPPAKVLVIGAGVAGLQAVATARRLGAVVTAHDVRAASKGEVESLGGRFLELPAAEIAQGQGGYAAEQPKDVQQRQHEVVAPVVANSDVVVTTASIPGRRAPLIITAEMVARMPQGAVVIDLAADSGGNCEVTELGRKIRHGGATVIGVPNPAGAMPMHASQLYSRNISTFVLSLVKDREMAPDFSDEVVSSTCVVRAGEVLHEPTVSALGGAQ